MSAPIVEAEYDTLTSISQQFDQQASGTETMVRQLLQRLGQLEGGGWDGDAAKAFYLEMNDELIPAANRLRDAFMEGGETAREIVRVIQAAEQEAANQFEIMNEGGSQLSTGSNLDEGSPDTPEATVRGGGPDHPQELFDALNEAMSGWGPWGWGTDEQAIFDLTEDATDEEKQCVLDDQDMMDRLEDDLNRGDMLRVLRNLNAPIEDQLNRAMDGGGTDEDGIFAAIDGATDAERQAVLDNAELMERLESELGRGDMLRVLRGLGAPIEDQLNRAMDNLIPLPTISAGPISIGVGGTLAVDKDALFDISEEAGATLTPGQRHPVLSNMPLMERLNEELDNNDLMRVADNLGFVPAPIQPLNNNNSSMADLFQSTQGTRGEDDLFGNRPIRLIQIGPNDFLISLRGTDPDALTGRDGLNNWSNARRTGSGFGSSYVDRVEQIIRENIPEGANINLAGHSQGGHVAVELTDDRNLIDDYNINSVTTFGSPSFNPFDSQINDRVGADRYNQFLIENDEIRTPSAFANGLLGGILLGDSDANDYTILPPERGNAHSAYGRSATLTNNTTLPFEIQNWVEIGAFG